MEINMQNKAGENAGSLELADATFSRDYNEALVHQVVTAYLAGSRAGTHAQKTRSQVRGGGAKPWRQKGTGRARAGTNCSPLWRTGGQTFAAVPQDYSQKVNRKMYKGAIASIISELLRTDRLVIVDSLDVDAPKTKELLAILAKLKIESALIVSEDPSENLYLAARNLHKVDICAASALDPINLIKFSHVLMTEGAVKALEGRLS